MNIPVAASLFLLCSSAPAGIENNVTQQPAAMKLPAPELQGIEAWINSDARTLKQMRGKVVVLHFWAFG